MEQYISSSRLSIHDMFESAYWVLPLLFLTYYATNTVFAKRKQIDHFPVGTPLAIAPKFILNLIFAGWAVDILQKGYKKVRYDLELLCSQHFLEGNPTNKSHL